MSHERKGGGGLKRTEKMSHIISIAPKWILLFVGHLAIVIN
jgi:hypothetical protein